MSALLVLRLVSRDSIQKILSYSCEGPGSEFACFHSSAFSHSQYTVRLSPQLTAAMVNAPIANLNHAVTTWDIVHNYVHIMP